MKSIIILYDGLEAPDHIINDMVAQLSRLNIESLNVIQLSDEEVNSALLKAIDAEQQSAISDQKAIDAAATYLTEKVLNVFNTPTSIAYAIGRYISCGDTKMSTAVEILATKKGLIKEPKLTKPILNTIKSIYEGIKHFN